MAFLANVVLLIPISFTRVTTDRRCYGTRMRSGVRNPVALFTLLFRNVAMDR